MPQDAPRVTDPQGQSGTNRERIANPAGHAEDDNPEEVFSDAQEE